MLDDAQGVEVMVEAKAVLAKRIIQRALSGVPEGRVADVVDQRERFGEVFIEAQRAGDGARDLRDLHRVRQAAAEVVGVAVREDLGLSGEATEGPRVEHTRPVALK